jgi:hypothetical protein
MTTPGEMTTLPETGHGFPRSRLVMAIAGGALLLVYGLLAPQLPRLSFWGGMAVTLVVNCLLLALLLYGLAPLHDQGLRALAVAGVGLAGALGFGFAGLIVPASLFKTVAAASLGFWLVGSVTSATLVVGIAALAAVVDIASVAVGPTKALLENAPSAVGALTVAMLWPGYASDAGYTALGVSDVIFMALYAGAAAKFRLRVRATVLACAAAIAVTVIAAVWFSALPVLPLLGVAFVGVNADLLFWRKRPSPPAAQPAGREGGHAAE